MDFGQAVAVVIVEVEFGQSLFFMSGQFLVVGFEADLAHIDQALDTRWSRFDPLGESFGVRVLGRWEQGRKNQSNERQSRGDSKVKLQRASEHRGLEIGDGDFAGGVD